MPNLISVDRLLGNKRNEVNFDGIIPVFFDGEQIGVLRHIIETDFFKVVDSDENPVEAPEFLSFNIDVLPLNPGDRNRVTTVRLYSGANPHA